MVIVGGGILTMELAAKIARFRGQRSRSPSYSRDRIAQNIREDIAPEAGSLGAKDVLEFMSAQLVKCGVKFIRSTAVYGLVGRRGVRRVSHDGGPCHIVATYKTSTV